MEMPNRNSHHRLMVSHRAYSVHAQLNHLPTVNYQLRPALMVLAHLQQPASAEPDLGHDELTFFMADEAKLVMLSRREAFAMMRQGTSASSRLCL